MTTLEKKYKKPKPNPIPFQTAAPRLVNFLTPNCRPLPRLLNFSSHSPSPDFVPQIHFQHRLQPLFLLPQPPLFFLFTLTDPSPHNNKPTAPQQPSPSLSPLASHQTSLPFSRSFFPRLTAVVSSITAAPSVPPEYRQHPHRPDLFAPLSHQRRQPRTNRQTPPQATAATPPPHSHRPICHPKQRRRRRNP